MPQLLAHLLGDYVLQNHWMANNKTTRTIPALIHVLLYGLPFLFLVSGWKAWAVIVGTHLIIDRFRLARYWCQFWGVGQEGAVVGFLRRLEGYTLDAERKVWVGLYGDEFPATPEAPPFLGVWLLILVDNIAHLAINAAVLRWM